MELQLIKESVVRGHHVYKDVWRPVIGELLPVFQETDTRELLNICNRSIFLALSPATFILCADFHKFSIS